ncbi:MAG: trans-2-enoyl-CoA reductase family protein [Gammaproteobacteria bacterium]|nr:trans-2-enoyl-CoA reductase family protein [Gammaproteobacteria bacterium]
MVIKPRIRGFICTTAHPIGCVKNVEDQVSYVERRPKMEGPTNALVVGCSTGYGLASRIAVAFGCGSHTLGVSLEKEPEERRPASAGWYNNVGFERCAARRDLYAKTINGDAFSNQLKQQVAEVVRAEMRPIDLLIYSLASPVRIHPESGEMFRSSIKPIGNPLKSRTLKLNILRGTCEVENIDLLPATDEEIDSTIKVMGGEDWILWIDALQKAGALSQDFKTVAYTYLGNELTWPIYRGGTLGKAKEDLDRARDEINGRFGKSGAEAMISVLKAVVTQASTAIPVVPLYFSILFKVMKAHGTHEDCIAHMYRMIGEQIYQSNRRIDDEGRIRMDNFELDATVQDEVKNAWDSIDTSNARDLADISGFRTEFLKLFGFGREDVDYERDVDVHLSTSKQVTQ